MGIGNGEMEIGDVAVAVADSLVPPREVPSFTVVLAFAERRPSGLGRVFTRARSIPWILPTRIRD
jgi:hypothetical protein